MIITANQTNGMAAKCSDGFLGHVDDLLFDDRSWKVEFIVVRFGGWFNRQRGLVLPFDVQSAEWAAGCLNLRLTQDQLRAAPILESHPPVAMQKLRETQIVAWDGYWSGVLDQLPADPHLRNTRAVTGHRVRGLDANVGYVDNFVIDDDQWIIRYLVVRMGRSSSAKRVLVEPRWVDSIIWERRGVHIHLPKTEIEHSQEFSILGQD
jgi:hypothetical protein